MTNLIKHKILYINNFNILLFNYKQLLKIFEEIQDLIDQSYFLDKISKDHKIKYEIILLDIKFSQCKRHIEYFKFKKMIRVRSMPIFNKLDN